jgi:transcriptional regulator with XRE-family HTH domain
MQVRDHRKLARLMLIQDVSQRDMATALGWKSHSYIGRIMRGTIRSVDPDAAVRIAHILGVAVDDLFITRASSLSGQSRVAS